MSGERNTRATDLSNIDALQTLKMLGILVSGYEALLNGEALKMERFLDIPMKPIIL